MSYSGEAADQVVRLSLNGVEVAAKLSGSAAKQLAIMIYAILKDQKKTKGKNNFHQFRDNTCRLEGKTIGSNAAFEREEFCGRNQGNETRND